MIFKQCMQHWDAIICILGDIFLKLFSVIIRLYIYTLTSVTVDHGKQYIYIGILVQFIVYNLPNDVLYACSPPLIYSSSNDLFLQFESDGAFGGSGFTLEFEESAGSGGGATTGTWNGKSVNQNAL